MRELDVVSWPDELRSLLVTWPLRWLRKQTLHDVGPGTLALLAELELPHLVELDLRDTSTPLQPADHRALWRPGGVGCHLHVLRVDRRASVEAWLAELVEHDWPVPVVDMEACSGAWQLRVARGPRWGQSTARFTSGRQSSLGPDPIQLLAVLLTRAPMDMFAHLEIDPVDSAGSAAWRPVHDALRRWPDLIVDRAPWLS